MADYLATVEKIQADGNLTQVPDSLVTPRLIMASRIVKQAITEDEYEDLLEEESPYSDQYIACQQAEVLIAVAKTFLFIGHDTSGKGVVGANILGDAHSQFLSFSELKDRHDTLMQEAWEILGPYIYDPDEAATSEEQDDSVRIPGLSMWVIPSLANTDDD